jgi:hypothetical protein
LEIKCRCSGTCIEKEPADFCRLFLIGDMSSAKKNKNITKLINISIE